MYTLLSWIASPVINMPHKIAIFVITDETYIDTSSLNKVHILHLEGFFVQCN